MVIRSQKGYAEIELTKEERHTFVIDTVQLDYFMKLVEFLSRVTGVERSNIWIYEKEE